MLAIPADAWVIEGAGLTVYPGFIDGLSTWGIPSAGGGANARRTAGAVAHLQRPLHLSRECMARRTGRRLTPTSGRRIW